jgi:hypothetical protein
MSKHLRLSRWCSTLAVLAFGCAALLAQAQQPAPLTPGTADKLRVLDRFRGTWDVTLKTTHPKPSVVTYTETYDWVLDGRFLQGDTGVKSDGVRDTIIGTYDPAGDGYPFWIFSSSGAWFYLPPGSWDEPTRTFRWKNLPNMTVLFESRCVFPDARTRRWSVLVKDWKGSVLLEQEGSAVRRER